MSTARRGFNSTGGYLPLIALSAKWEQAFAGPIVGQDDDRQLAMQPSMLSEFITLVREKFEVAARESEAPTLVGRHNVVHARHRGVLLSADVGDFAIGNSPAARLKTVSSI